MGGRTKFPWYSLVFNAVYSAYYLTFGVFTTSWWLLTLGLYYFLLSIVRFVVLRNLPKTRFVMRFTGYMLMALVVPLVGTVILSVIQDRGREYHMIVMIGIATYAFTKITLSTINLIRSRHNHSGKLAALRNISFADGLVSIFALQRSMLVSFEGMTGSEICLMNTLTGSAVCLTVFYLGYFLVIDRQ